MSDRKFYRHSIIIDFLSEESDAGSGMSLAQIGQEMDEGRYVGRILSGGTTELTPKQTADTCYVFGSEPTFFQLDDDGKDTE